MTFHDQEGKQIGSEPEIVIVKSGDTSATNILELFDGVTCMSTMLFYSQHAVVMAVNSMFFSEHAAVCRKCLSAMPINNALQ